MVVWANQLLCHSQLELRLSWAVTISRCVSSQKIYIYRLYSRTVQLFSSVKEIFSEKLIIFILLMIQSEMFPESASPQQFSCSRYAAIPRCLLLYKNWVVIKQIPRKKNNFRKILRRHKQQNTEPSYGSVGIHKSLIIKEGDGRAVLSKLDKPVSPHT